MKKIMVCLLAILLVSSFVMVGCGGTEPAPTPSPQPSPAPTPEPTPTVNPLTLTVSGPSSSSAWMWIHAWEPWQNQIEQATDGRVKFETYFGETLMKQNATWEGLQSGVADMSLVLFHLYPGMVDLTNAIALPFLEYQSAEQEAGVAWQLYEKFPEIQNEYKAAKLLMFVASTPFFFLTSEKQIKAPEDFNGLKLRIPGEPALSKMMELVGVVPVRTSASEMYMNVERGVLDGTFCNWDTFLSYRMYEVGSYLTHGPFNAGAMGLCMSPAAWDKLSAQDREIIISFSGLKGSELWSKNTYDMAVQAAYDTAHEEGFETIDYYFTPEQVEAWKERNSAEVWGIWMEKAVAKAKDQGSANPDAVVQDILDTTVNLVKNYTP